MSIVNDLISALFEKSKVTIEGGLTVRLEQGSITITGQFPVTVVGNDGKTVASLEVPFDASIEIAEMTIPIPTLQ